MIYLQMAGSYIGGKTNMPADRYKLLQSDCKMQSGRRWIYKTILWKLAWCMWSQCVWTLRYHVLNASSFVQSINSQISQNYMICETPWKGWFIRASSRGVHNSDHKKTAYPANVWHFDHLSSDSDHKSDHKKFEMDIDIDFPSKIARFTGFFQQFPI